MSQSRLLLLLLVACAGNTAPTARGAVAAASAADPGPLYVLVAAPPRMGTTWLFNAARILVRYHDPNMISGWATSFGDRDVCYWRQRNVSMVVKTHALNYGWMLGANCAAADGSGTAHWTPGFDLALSAYRDPFDTACSLVKKDGAVQKDMCEKVLCEQHAFYHPPALEGLGPDGAMKVVFELDFRELMAAQQGVRAAGGDDDGDDDDGGAGGGTQSSSGSGEGARVIMRSLLRRLATALGLGGRFSASVLDLVGEELSKLRPLGDPKHSLRSAQHPVTLMHANHKAVNASSAACDASAAVQAMRRSSTCAAWAQAHGQVSEALWARNRWRGHCVTLKHKPVPSLPAA